MTNFSQKLVISTPNVMLANITFGVLMTNFISTPNVMLASHSYARALAANITFGVLMTNFCTFAASASRLEYEWPIFAYQNEFREMPRKLDST